MRIHSAGHLLLSMLLLSATTSGAAPSARGGVPRLAQDQPQYQDQDQGQYQDQQPPAFQNFSPEELDNLLAPIALYPDPLLAQVLVAATFPDQVDEAARFLRSGADPNGIDYQPWDVSVKSVAHYPTVLYMMDNRLDWTTSVGQAYVNQSTDVQTSIQRLRELAHNAGTLQSGPQIEVVQDGPYWNIWPVNPQLIYVPVYNPAFVYYGRPGWYGSYITFGAGFPIGSWLCFDFDWGRRGVFYHGWGGDERPWAVRSRPFIQVNNNIYINNRYRNVEVNREVLRRPVNYDNLNRYNAVHHEVNYSNRQSRAYQSTGPRPVQRNNAPPPNQLVQRNINVGDSRIQDFRGREGGGPQMTMEGQGGRPAPPQPVQQRPAPQRAVPAPAPQRPMATPAPQARPQYEPAPRPTRNSAYNVERGPFPPAQTSQRGEQSRQQMSRPAPVYRPPPAPRPSPPPRPSGGGRRP